MEYSLGLDVERKTAAQQIIDELFAEVERRYGTGIGDGETPLAYHSLRHSRDVSEAGGQIALMAAEAGKILPSDIELVKIAGAGHDLEHNLGSELNERASAALTTDKMHAAGVFGEDDLHKVDEMIMATIARYNGVISQSATGDYLTQILADADLWVLGAPPHIFWNNAFRYLQETKGKELILPGDIHEFLKVEEAVVTSHHFYTPEAEQLFPHKPDIIEFIARHIKDTAPKTDTKDD